MAEEVETGGTKRFVYEKGYSPRLSENRKREIEIAYSQSEERKRQEKRTKKFIIAGIIIFIIILSIIILL